MEGKCSLNSTEGWQRNKNCSAEAKKLSRLGKRRLNSKVSGYQYAKNAICTAIRINAVSLHGYLRYRYINANVMATMPARSKSIITGWSIRGNNIKTIMVVRALYIRLMLSTANNPFTLSTRLNKFKAILLSYTMQ